MDADGESIFERGAFQWPLFTHFFLFFLRLREYTLEYNHLTAAAAVAAADANERRWRR